MSASTQTNYVESIEKMASGFCRSIACRRLLVPSPRNLGLNALRYNIPESCVLFSAHHEWMRFAGFPRLEFGEPIRRIVEDRVVLNFDIHFHPLRDIQVMADRTYVLLQSGCCDSIQRQDRPAEDSRNVSGSAVFYREDERRGRDQEEGTSPLRDPARASSVRGSGRIPLCRHSRSR